MIDFELVKQAFVAINAGSENMDELMEKPGAFAKIMEMKKIVIAEFYVAGYH